MRSIRIVAKVSNPAWMTRRTALDPCLLWHLGVRYSGEFHPRPQGGWQNFRDDMYDSDVPWELVIDNNSGTYSPDPTMLPALKACMEYNFQGFNIIALDYNDPALKESVDACRAYALSARGVDKEDLQPHVHNGEITLQQEVAHLSSDTLPPP